MREWIYGVGHPEGNEDVYIARYERDNREVMEYFKHRSEQLLVFNITAGEGWTKRCPFLDGQVPAISFPCANTVAEREKLLRRESFWPRRMYRNFRRHVKQLMRSSTAR